MTRRVRYERTWSPAFSGETPKLRPNVSMLVPSGQRAVFIGWSGRCGGNTQANWPVDKSLPWNTGTNLQGYCLSWQDSSRNTGKQVQILRHSYLTPSSVVVNRLPLHAHKEKNARRAGPGAFRVRCCEAQGFLSSATTRMWRDRLFAESRPLSGFGGKKKVRGTS